MSTREEKYLEDIDKLMAYYNTCIIQEETPQGAINVAKLRDSQELQFKPGLPVSNQTYRHEIAELIKQKERIITTHPLSQQFKIVEYENPSEVIVKPGEIYVQDIGKFCIQVNGLQEGVDIAINIATKKIHNYIDDMAKRIRIRPTFSNVTKAGKEWPLDQYLAAGFNILLCKNRGVKYTWSGDHHSLLNYYKEKKL